MWRGLCRARPVAGVLAVFESVDKPPLRCTSSTSSRSRSGCVPRAGATAGQLPHACLLPLAQGAAFCNKGEACAAVAAACQGPAAFTPGTSDPLVMLASASTVSHSPSPLPLPFPAMTLPMVHAAFEFVNLGILAYLGNESALTQVSAEPLGWQHCAPPHPAGLAHLQAQEAAATCWPAASCCHGESAAVVPFM